MNHLSLFTALAASSSENIKDSVDAVTELSGAINEYGIAVVIMAVFFVIFLLLIFLILRNNNKMMNHIVQNQSGNNKFEEDMLAKLIDNALNNRMESNKSAQNAGKKPGHTSNPAQKDPIDSDTQITEDAIHRDLVGAYIDVNMAFKDASRSALSALRCSRVAIYIFHNGNKSMHGLPFFKMSCIHEWTTKGSNTLRGKSHIDLPLHMFADFVDELWRHGVYKSQNVANSALEDNSLNEFIEYSKTKALYINVVKDNDDVIAGFVVAEFDKEDTFETDSCRDREIKTVLDKMVMKISPILTYHHIRSNKNSD